MKFDALLSGVLAEYHDTLPSTQVRARELAGEGAKRAVVAAGEQTAGRGRLDRRWESPKGSGLYFSILSRPALPAGSAHLVNAAAALAVADAARSVAGAELWLKWPNDLMTAENRKVCGILSESATRGGVIEHCITGIGINLYAPPGLPCELEGRAGWLRGPGEKEDKGDINAARLLAGAVKNFFDWVDLMEREGAGRMLAAYREKCASLGRVVRVETDAGVLTGLCTGIGDGGELVVETPEGTRRFHVGDVIHAGVELD